MGCYSVQTSLEPERQYLTSTVVAHLTTCIENDKSIDIAYIYCKFKRRNDEKDTDFLASLLKQLVPGRSSLPDRVKSLHNSHKKTNAAINLRNFKRSAICFCYLLESVYHCWCSWRVPSIAWLSNTIDRRVFQTPSSMRTCSWPRDPFPKSRKILMRTVH